MIVYYQNCRGLRTKLNTLFMNILSECYDIIVLTETWLVPDIHENLFIDSRYSVYRCDRDRDATGKKDGSGVLVAVRRGLAVHRLPLPLPPPAPRNSLSPTSLTNLAGTNAIPPIVDYVIIEFVNEKNNLRHILCALYLPPNQPYSTYKLFFNTLQKIFTSNNVASFYLLGDFNIPTLDWLMDNKGLISSVLSTNSSCIDNYLTNYLSFLNARQFNNIRNNKNRILDLLISNSSSLTCDPPSTPLVPIDPLHPPFLTYISLRFGVDFKTMARNLAPRFQFVEGNYEAINEEIRKVDWQNVLCKLNVEEATTLFYEHMYRIIKNNVPTRSVKSNNFPIWFSRPLIHLFKNKTKLG